MKIKSIKAREILDSRSNPTVEVEMIIDNGVCGIASVPSGASTGSKEAIELRDNDERYHGKGVLKAVYNVNNIIAPKLEGMDLNQADVDKKLLELDGTYNKSKLGANAILAVSLAALKCLAKSAGKDLYEYVSDGDYSMPVPMINVINGGAHADNNLDIQEFMIVPLLETEEKRIRAASEVFITLKTMLKKDGMSTGVGDEGGFAPNLSSNEECFKYLMEAIKKSGYEPGKDIALAIDAAASEFYDESTQKYTLDNKLYSAMELKDYYLDLIEKYPIISIEDPFEEEDADSFALLTKEAGHKIMVVGDDFFVSQAKYLQMGIDKKAANAILLKANQVGSVTEFIETINLAKANNIKMIISHRSGETEDTFIADLGVGLNIPYIKTGSVSRGERVAKYNRLTKIENELMEKIS
ncbi:MAG: phosphopyruvate hydratase [Firmicutes bacterium]|nr:phosphopyruvate hydratase [Bacillota bacterium]